MIFYETPNGGYTLLPQLFNQLLTKTPKDAFAELCVFSAATISSAQASNLLKQECDKFISDQLREELMRKQASGEISALIWDIPEDLKKRIIVEIIQHEADRYAQLMHSGNRRMYGAKEGMGLRNIEDIDVGKMQQAIMRSTKETGHQTCANLWEAYERCKSHASRLLAAPKMTDSDVTTLLYEHLLITKKMWHDTKNFATPPTRQTLRRVADFSTPYTAQGYMDKAMYSEHERATDTRLAKIEAYLSMILSPQEIRGLKQSALENVYPYRDRSLDGM